ncbi:MAG: DUF3841 domain-containing protein [Propionicimonas sp.]|nr:DUF3841 domain-containing protein [Propionicimonas sp.]
MAKPLMPSVSGTPVNQLPCYQRLPSRRALAAPALRTSFTLDQPTLTLNTIQTRTAYEALWETGVLTLDPALAEEGFEEAYAWMAQQMAHRLSTHGDGILWLWAKYSRRELVREARRCRGEVLLTVHVERERVLLRYFDDWHMVLNNGYLVSDVPGETYDEYDARYEVASHGWDARSEGLRNLPRAEWPADLRAELEATWQAIFDPAVLAATRSVQATVHEILATDVVRAVRIA